MALRILFVEKDAAVADWLVAGLDRKGYEVTLVRTQRQAIARLGSARPDLLIVDVASFGGNGYKVCEALRSRAERVATLLLLEKGHGSMAGAADSFMTKPFTSRGLLHRVRKLAESVTSRELRAGPFALDPETRNLRKGDTTYYLRPKEAALLSLFMNNPGRVLTRQEIMKQVWDTDYMGDTRTLSVHIRWLREKLEVDPHYPRFLRTVRGVGYRFEVPQE